MPQPVSANGDAAKHHLVSESKPWGYNIHSDCDAKLTCVWLVIDSVIANHNDVDDSMNSKNSSSIIAH